ncbi:hypothetical protein FRB96_003749 [Tulasnella sp. 330]|nr:hypothetical protein FRB96_003749 [Tulasnella sp. 330]KAG8880214.1 hypothetical protein FRB97_000983 [Tulasnella sp. 331]
MLSHPATTPGVSSLRDSSRFASSRVLMSTRELSASQDVPKASRKSIKRFQNKHGDGSSSQPTPTIDTTKRARKDNTDEDECTSTESEGTPPPWLQALRRPAVTSQFLSASELSKAYGMKIRDFAYEKLDLGLTPAVKPTAIMELPAGEQAIADKSEESKTIHGAGGEARNGMEGPGEAAPCSPRKVEASSSIPTIEALLVYGTPSPEPGTSCSSPENTRTIPRPSWTSTSPPSSPQPRLIIGTPLGRSSSFFSTPRVFPELSRSSSSLPPPSSSRSAEITQGQVNLGVSTRLKRKREASGNGSSSFPEKNHASGSAAAATQAIKKSASYIGGQAKPNPTKRVKVHRTKTATVL